MLYGTVYMTLKARRVAEVRGLLHLHHVAPVS